MKMLLTLVTFLVTLSGVCLATDGGNESPFSLGAGARELSLGGSGVVTADAATSPYWNPSNLALAQQLSFGGFYSRLYDSDVAYQFMGLALPTLDLGTFGLGVFRLGVDGIERRDEQNLMLGTFSEQRLAVYAAYGRSVGNYRVGFSTQIEYQSLADRTATSSPGVSLALGRTFNTGTGLIRAGEMTLVLRNAVSPSLTLLNESVKLPFNAQFGSKLLFAPSGSNSTTSLSAAFGSSAGSGLQSAFGLEHSVHDMLTLRGGWTDGKLSCGAGIQFGPMTFDYALVDRDLGSLHMFSLTSRLGSSVEERRAARESRREREFEQIMSSRIDSQNRQMIDELVSQGRAALESNALDKASTDLDRALFLCRASDADTTEIAALAAEAHRRFEALAEQEQIRELIDSASSNFDRGDLVGTRYFAGLVLSIDSTSARALDLMTRTESASQDADAQVRLVRGLLGTLDSLANSGRITEAASIYRSLEQYASDYPEIMTAGKRMVFEQQRRNAEAALSSGDLSRAVAAADSASAIYPEHLWLRTFRDRADKAKVTLAKSNQTSATAGQIKLSAAVRKEAETAYGAGQRAFAEGDLNGAIAQWEEVNRLAPDFKLVREYLVRAYKLLGIDLYGKNQLERAITTWEKALALVPGSAEISNYIARTRGEVARLEEAENDN